MLRQLFQTLQSLLLSGLLLLPLGGALSSHAELAGALKCPARMYGMTRPTAVKDVPAVLPCNGVNVRDLATLLPLGQISGLLSRQQAIALAFDSRYPVTGSILASVTIPGTIPPPYPVVVPGTTKPITWRTVENVPAWVISDTFPAQDVCFRGYTPLAPPPPPHSCDARHMNVVIDARTGAFWYGFFTP